MRGVQTKLRINEPGDAYEHEADRVADQVLAKPVHSGITNAPLRIQRFSVQPNGPLGAAPSSVDYALASPGRPLEPGLRQDMEQRFGHDFSRVRVHTDTAAEQSAQDVGAHAYTVGHSIVFDAGRFAPQTQEGRRLIAHELTHTIQQSSRYFAAPPGTVLQRTPDNKYEELLKEPQFLKGTQRLPYPGQFTPVSPTTFPTAGDENDPLYFGHMPVICTNCHQTPEQKNFPTHQQPSGERVVEWKIREWAVAQVLEIAFAQRENRKKIFSLIQRKEDKALHDLWEPYLDGVIATVIHDVPEHPIFSGSDAARRRFAGHLSENYSKLISKVDEKAIDRLVIELKEVLRSGLVLSRATLETDAKMIARIDDDHPDNESFEIGNPRTISHERVTVGWPWQHKRVKSIGSSTLHFEVIGHEGLYFRISRYDFLATDPYWAKFAGEIAENTAGIVVLGDMIKGFLNALISPIKMALDTGAKVLDMASMAVSAAGKKWGWYDIGYTCFSSTCQQYEKCLDNNEKPDKCKADIMEEALKEATVIIPLYEQGRECLKGGRQAAEACGAIAALALGLVEEGGGRLSKAKVEKAAGGAKFEEATVAAPKGGKVMTPAAFEEAAIREAIGRPREGDPSIARALEKQKKARAETKSEMPEPKRTTAEVAELPKDAADPSKARPLDDQRFDAEIATSNSRVTYKRERGTNLWDRCWNPCKRVGQLGGEVDRAFDALTSKRKRTKPAPDKPLSKSEYEKTRAAAKKELKRGDKPGQISAEVARHKDQPVIRKVEGLSGKSVQSAHDAPSSFMKTLDDYSRDNAITVLLERGKHRSFDQYWKDWAQDQRRLGHTEVSVQELHNVMAEAIDRAPISDGQKSALFTLLNEELSDLPSDKLTLPYRTTKALPPGPELTALKKRIADEQKAKQRDPDRAAAVKREQADLRKTIADYEAIIKRLSRDPKARATVDAYRLEVAKLKKQLGS
jgi:hypothetical protein